LRRKDELFKRYKKDQEEKLTSKRMEVEKEYMGKETVSKLLKHEFTLRSGSLGGI
jgi:hypothetical protein